MINIKTLEEWEIGNHVDFDEYVKVGDAVDDDIALYFAEVCVGGYIDDEYSQCGEASDYINGEFVYTTFKKVEAKEYWERIEDMGEIK